MTTDRIAALRKEYSLRALEEKDLAPDPFQQFSRWFDEAVSHKLPEPNAFILSTVSQEGQPSSRAVLLKGYDSSGFVFYTNYESRKGSEISQNNRVSMLFLWIELEHQIRIEGTGERITSAESDAYFASRPRGAQIGSAISPQSSIIPSRAYLEEQAKELDRKHAGQAIPRPIHWGGFRIVPARFEFWQGRESRLHDRLVYQRATDSWNISRLAP